MATIINVVICVLIILTSIVQVYATIANGKTRYTSKKLTILSIICGSILCVCWLITGIYLQRVVNALEPVWVDYIFVGLFALYVLAQIIFLIDIKKTEAEECLS